MRVILENYGAVEKADVELGDLTVIAGENSTGKTQVTYTIWDILKNTSEYLRYKPTNEKEQQTINMLAQNLQKHNKATCKVEDLFNLNDEYNLYNNYFISDKYKLKYTIGKEYINTHILQLSESNFIFIDDNKHKLQFTNAKQINSTDYVGACDDVNTLYIVNNMDISISIYDIKFKVSIDIKISPEELNFYLQYGLDDFNFSISDSDKEKYQENIDDIENTVRNIIVNDDDSILDKLDSDELKTMLMEMLAQVYTIPNNVEIATSERVGVFSFFYEFIGNKIQQKRNRYEIGYLKPINENILFHNMLPTIVYSKQKDNEKNIENTHLNNLLTYLEKNLLKGRLHISQFGDPYFTPANSEKEKESIPFRYLSSSIKSLTMIYFQLKYSPEFNHKAIRNGTCYYVIDEPEAFLHPANQIKMARLIAMMVNTGIKVIINTHSDYLLRELNGLIDLGSLNPSNDDIEKYNLHLLKDKKIDKQLLKLSEKSIKFYYMTNENSEDNNKYRTEEINVKKYGGHWYSFDDTLNEQKMFFSQLGKLDKELNKNDEKE